jgi:hypothetical protein
MDLPFHPFHNSIEKELSNVRIKCFHHTRRPLPVKDQSFWKTYTSSITVNLYEGIQKSKILLIITYKTTGSDKPASNITVI